MDDDDLYYLQTGFDLSSLTVPKLRSILVAHDVSYPSSAKKQDLVGIVEENILPKAKKLLSAQARIRRTSKGIENVPSSQEDDVEMMPPPPAPKTPRSRKSKTNLRSEEETPKTVRKTRTPSARRSVRKPRESDTETDDKPLPSARRAKRTNADVEISEHAYPSRKSLVAEDSPFSTDNPFQSGSSPAPEPRTVSKSRKSDARKSVGSTKPPVVVKSETYEVPLSRIGVDKSGVETTEEFTPEEDQQLQRELASDGRLARSRTSALTRKQPASTTAKLAPLAILVAVLGAIGSWYRQEKLNIGYCGIGEPSWSLLQNSNIPAWAHEHLQPQCDPCPPHAICFPGMEAKCEDDFVLQQHPLSLNGLIPLPPTCEPDSEKERRIKAVADRAIEELRERRAAYECGDTTTTSVSNSETEVQLAAIPTKLEIAEDTLKQEVSKMRRRGMTAEEFEDLWKGALGDIIQRDEVEVLRDGSRIYLSSTSLARLPFSCAIRRSAVQAISRNRIPIATLAFASIILAYARYRYIDYNQAKAQTPSLVAMTLDKLATQAALKETGRVQEAFISVGQLRDDVLRNVFSVQERERVWQRVRKIVESNSNVRAATREGSKTGEWSRVWEWIGPVDLIHNFEGRISGGFSRATESPETRLQDTRKWDEGRPIY